MPALPRLHLAHVLTTGDARRLHSLNARGRTVLWFVAAMLLLAAAVGFSVRVDQGRLAVRWAPSTPSHVRHEAATAFGMARRRAIEHGEAADPNAESFVLINPDAGVLSALRRHPAVDSVEPVDGPLVDALARRISIVRIPQYAWLRELQVQSAVLLLLAGCLLAGAAAVRRRVRILVALLCTAALVAAAFAIPLDRRVKMGDLDTYTASRARFDAYFGGATVRFEAHLTCIVLRLLDHRLGADEASPAAAFAWLSRLATLWFAAMLLVAAAAAEFRPAALRFLALAVAAPASIMYFGYQEIGYLALTPAVFPLMALGFEGRRGCLEGGSVLAGLGAALHGFGVLSIVGGAAAALAAPAAWPLRMTRLWRIAALAATAYLGWIFLYVVGLNLAIEPGHAGGIPWRPMLLSTLWNTRVNWAVFSTPGALDIAAACWMAGVPLAFAAMAAAAGREAARPALAFALPSVVFLCAFWPVQGLAVEADLVVAAFPGVYALAWLAARSPRATVLALILLAGSHIVFWRVIFSDAFVASRA